MHPIGDEWARAAWSQAWQVTVLVVVVALATRLVARRRPHLAYVLWLVVLVKCLTPPLWSSPGGAFSWIERMVSGGSAGREVAASQSPAADAAIEHRPFDPTQSPPHQPSTEPLPAESAFVAEVAEIEQRHRFTPSGGRAEPHDPARPVGITDALLAGWLAGLILMLGIAAVRWARCLRLVRRSGRRSDPSYDWLLARLSQRLRLRRVRLLITGSRVGPAVVGLVRPTVLLPEMILRGKSTGQLEPILAHELIHVRRGDLWVGLIQTLVQAIWWFHPLVWWASRRAWREAEACCDEQVVAELGCKPADYARTLLDILQQKRSLQLVPAFPGVRPVEVTSSRLERIMSLRQGSRKRTPWWCWAVMLVAALLTLPGAAVVVAANDDPPPPKPLVEPLQKGYAIGAGPADLVPPLPNPYQSESPTARRLAAPPSGESREPSVTRVYRVADLLADLQTELELSEPEAKQHLANRLSGAGGGLGLDKPSIEWSGKRLVARHSARGHERMATALDALRKYGFGQVLIHVHIVSGLPEAVDSAAGNWTILPTDVPGPETPEAGLEAMLSPIDRPPPDDRAAPSIRAQMVVEKNLPVVFQILDEKKAGELLARLRDHRRINVLQAPKVVVFNGQWAAICDCSQSPFVVGLKDGEPQIRVVPDGLAIRLRPLLEGDDSVRLECLLTLSDIRGWETSTILQGPAGKPVTLQIPEVAKTELDTGVRLALGETLVVGGLKHQDADGRAQSMLVMLRAEKVSADRRLGAQKPVFARTYNVADLVVPMPERVVVSDQRDALAQKPEPPVRPDFQPLADLITSTVAPETWEQVGGRGSIRPLAKTLSVVVTQTEEVHEEIAELLRQLRRSQNVQVMLDASLVRVPDEMLETAAGESYGDWGEGSYAIIGARKARDFLAFAKGQGQAGMGQSPKLIVFNAQHAEITLPPQTTDGSARFSKLLVQSVVTKNRRYVRLTVALKPQDPADELADAKSVVVPDGQTLLLDVTDRLLERVKPGGTPLLNKVPHVSRLFRETSADPSGQRTLVLLTPSIIVREEEERRLSLPPFVSAGTSRIIIQEEEEERLGTPSLTIAVVSPRIIIQEDEEERLGILSP